MLRFIKCNPAFFLPEVVQEAPLGESTEDGYKKTIGAVVEDKVDAGTFIHQNT